MVEILVLPKSCIDPLKYEGSLNDFYSLLDSKGIWMERDKAEVDENFLQLIPYILVKRQDVRKNNFIFTYRRLKGGAETRLHDKYSIGIGGHVDRPEKHQYSPSTAFYAAAKLELNEELSITGGKVDIFTYGIQNNDKDQVPLIYDPTNAVGRVHLGLLMEAIVEPGANIEVKEKDKIDGQLIWEVDLGIMRTYKKITLEGWSEIAWSML